MTLHVVRCGDAALTVHFADRPCPALAARIAALHRTLAEQRPAGFVESIPGLTTLTVLFDPSTSAAAAVEASVLQAYERSAGRVPAARRWRIPVCYEGDCAPDLEAVGKSCGLAPADVVAAHTSRAYTVYLLGFSPGFPYMGDLDPRLVLPRRAEPRVRVPAGAVAIADGYTAIYPQSTAGGWHLLGATPVRLFDSARDHPALLAAGDSVSFYAVSRDEIARLPRDPMPAT